LIDPEIKTELEAVETRLLERIERTETTLLKEFRKWAIPIDAHLRVNKAYSIGFDERLSSLEERMNNLEKEEN
jgi:hypothetical protein